MNSPITKQQIVATQPTTSPIKPTASPVDLKPTNVTSQSESKPISFMTSQDAKPPNPMTSQNLLNFRSFVLHSWLLHNMQQQNPPPVAKATVATTPPSVQPQQPPGFNPHQIRVVCEALQCDVERLARFLWSLPAHPQVIQVRVVNMLVVFIKKI